MTIPDRLAIVWASFLNVLFFMYVSSVLGLSAWLGAVLSWEWLRFMFFAVVPLWMLMRLIAWACRRPEYRPVSYDN